MNDDVGESRLQLVLGKSRRSHGRSWERLRKVEERLQSAALTELLIRPSPGSRQSARPATCGTFSGPSEM